MPPGTDRALGCGALGEEAGGSSGGLGGGEVPIQANPTHKRLIYKQKCHWFINKHKGIGGCFTPDAEKPNVPSHPVKEYSGCWCWGARPTDTVLWALERLLSPDTILWSRLCPLLPVSSRNTWSPQTAVTSAGAPPCPPAGFLWPPLSSSPRGAISGAAGGSSNIICTGSRPGLASGRLGIMPGY